jgi:predicted MFS family arabinose efflux permease
VDRDRDALTAGIAATAAWSEAESRTRVVARAFAGPPTAWILGMPLIGVVAEVHWRLAFLALPLPAALLAAVALANRPRDTPISSASSSLRGLLRRPDARRWALGELAANAAWAGTLVYGGALLTEGTAYPPPRPGSPLQPSRSRTSSATGR